MKAIAIVLMLFAATGTAFAKPVNVPLPRPKPDSVKAQQPDSVKSQPIQQVVIQQGEPTSANSPCAKLLREIADFTPLPDSAGPGECGASDRVQLEAVKMPDGSRVKMQPTATLRCPMAEAIAEWVRSDLGPAALEHGSALRVMMAGTSYHCRPRNGVKGAKISEHGRGNAVDLTTLKLANGAVIDLARAEASKPFRDRARASACSRFTTVLGPGADAQHEDHIHVDLAERSRGYRMCQWDVREPMVASAKPEPTPPAAAPPAAPPAAGKLVSEPQVASRPPAPAGEAVPLPLRRPFELVFAMRKSTTRR